MKKILLIGLCMSGSLFGMESEESDEQNMGLLKELKKTEPSDDSAVNLHEEIKQLKELKRLKKPVDEKVNPQELEVVAVEELIAYDSELRDLRGLVDELKAKIAQLEESNKDVTTKLQSAQRLCKIEEAAVSIGLGVAGVIVYFVLFG